MTQLRRGVRAAEVVRRVGLGDAAPLRLGDGGFEGPAGAEPVEDQVAGGVEDAPQPPEGGRHQVAAAGIHHRQPAAGGGAPAEPGPARRRQRFDLVEGERHRRLVGEDHREPAFQRGAGGPEPGAAGLEVHRGGVQQDPARPREGEGFLERDGLRPREVAQPAPRSLPARMAAVPSRLPPASGPRTKPLRSPQAATGNAAPYRSARSPARPSRIRSTAASGGHAPCRAAPAAARRRKRTS